MDEQPKFEQWCVVELYGRSRIAGLVSEQVIGGIPFIRVEVPEVKREDTRWTNGERRAYSETIAAFTKFYGGGAIYAITPTTEAIARAVAQGIATRPISVFELPKLDALPEPPDDDDLDVDDRG